MKGTKKTYLVRRIDGRILSAIVITEVKNKKGAFMLREPEIFIAVNETYSNADVQWAKFDGTITNPRRILKSDITLSQLLAPVYTIMCKYKWPLQLWKKFILLGTAANALSKSDTEAVYYQDWLNIEIPETSQARGVKCVQYAEKFEPVKEAIWEELVYG